MFNHVSFAFVHPTSPITVFCHNSFRFFWCVGYYIIGYITPTLNMQRSINKNKSKIKFWIRTNSYLELLFLFLFLFLIVVLFIFTINETQATNVYCFISYVKICVLFCWCYLFNTISWHLPPCTDCSHSDSGWLTKPLIKITHNIGISSVTSFNWNYTN